MSAFIRHLKSEHATFLDGLDVLQRFESHLRAGFELDSGHTEDLRMLLFALHASIEKSHHAKEERLLFPALLKSGKLQEGGPRCTHFMGLRITDDVAGRVLARAQSVTQQPTAIDPSVSPTCALSMPLEEHAAGHLGLLMLRSDLDAMASRENWRSHLLSSMWDYQQLMRRHIEKEDQCLFVIADSVLNETEQLELLGQAHQLDRALGFEPIRTLRSIVDQLTRTMEVA